MASSLRLKAALLSCCFITASLNAITGNIPEMAKTFFDYPLYVIELISTIPSLFQMAAILISGQVGRRLGLKGNILLGAALCGISGTLPVWIQSIPLILLSRAVFGFGVGLIASSMLSLIVYFFDGQSRSTMIGMQGSIGGLGSFTTAFLSGRLLTFGWNVSFATYYIDFLVLLIVAFFVPRVERQNAPQGKKKEVSFKTPAHLSGFLLICLLMFFSTMFATVFIIKAATLITQSGYGTSEDGSAIIMLISLGSLCSGALYGKMYARMKDLSLVLFYLICAAAFFMGGLIQNLYAMLFSAFLLGFGLIAFTPFLQEKIHTRFPQHGQIATRMILISQSLGSFLTPYAGTLLEKLTKNLHHQFFLTGSAFLLLAVIAVFLHRKEKKALSLLS